MEKDRQVLDKRVKTFKENKDNKKMQEQELAKKIPILVKKISKTVANCIYTEKYQ